MDLIDVHNTIDTMKFSSFVDDYMYDDAFHDMVKAAGITPSDFLEQKIGEALDPIRFLAQDDYSVGETSLKNRRYLEDAAYAQGRGLTASLQKNIFAGLNGENAGLDNVEARITKTVDIGEDFLANMNAISGIVGYGIKKAFRAAGDDRGYGYLLSGAIANARQKHLTPENTVKYVQKCGVSNIIYNSAWAGMNGEPIQTMKGLGYSRLMSSTDVQRYDISDGLAEKVVNRFCKNKEAAQVFKNINDGTQDPFG